ncbi:hypothetical protein EMMF5_000088 [Cystobasidiomycetes sp. EMM_F5]
MKRSNKAVVDAKADTESAKRRRVEVSDFEPVDVSKLEGSKLDLADCETYYVAQFVDKATAMRWYNELLELDTWYQPTLRMYGRSFLQSRQIVAYGNEEAAASIKYSGTEVPLQKEHPPILREIQSHLEDTLKTSFNHCKDAGLNLADETAG